MAGWDVAKVDPADVVRVALEDLRTGQIEVLVDDDSRAVNAALSSDPAAFYAQQLGSR